MRGPCTDSWLQRKWELWEIDDALFAGIRTAVSDWLHHEEGRQTRLLEALLHDPHRLQGHKHVIVTIDSNYGNCFEIENSIFKASLNSIDFGGSVDFLHKPKNCFHLPIFSYCL